MEKYALIIILGYGFGCMQWSYILTKLIKKTDIRTVGVGNAGASNMVISYGWKMGALVAILDISKAIISILIIKYIFDLTDPSSLYLNGAGVILGHNYPFFMHFRGGKGTASTLGMLFGINYKLGLLGLLIIALVALSTNYIVLGTMALVTFIIVATIYLDLGYIPIIIAIFIGIQSIYKHLPNLKRILSKNERGIRSTIKKKKTMG